MADKAVSPLRRRMIEDMTIRKLAPKTQHDLYEGLRVKRFFAINISSLPTFQEAPASAVLH